MFDTIMAKLKTKKKKIAELENEIKSIDYKIYQENNEVICLENKSNAIQNGIAKVDLRKIEKEIQQLRIFYKTPSQTYMPNEFTFAQKAIARLEAVFIASIIEEK